LTPEQSEYVRRRVERDFGNVSEFFRELIRERMRQEIAADLALLKATAKGAPAGPSEEEIDGVISVQRDVRKELMRARRL
jgi:Arc/MetJ-type ribon-helix-helix transcriptional regulator